MDKRTIITLGIILAVIIGAFSFLIFNPTARDAAQKNIESSAVDPQTTSTDTSQAQSATTEQAGKYVTYSADALAADKGTKLLFFHAPWCPQCRDLDADINKQGVPSGTTVYKVDYDSNQTLRQKYGVTIQTTVVKVDDSGNLVKKYVAYKEPNLNSVLTNLQ